MTKEQRESLSRVKATYSYAHDIDMETASYRTDDVENVLSALEDQSEKLLHIEEDLEEIRLYLENLDGDPDKMVRELLESTIMFLNGEE